MILLVNFDNYFLYAQHAASRKIFVCLAILSAVIIAEMTAALAAPASSTGRISFSPMPPMATTGVVAVLHTCASFFNPAAQPAFVFVAVA